MYAVITGASSGFGKEFARQFSILGYDLCLVARNEERLNSIKSNLEADYKNKIDIFLADLTKPEEADKLYNYTKDKNVDVLINNAGMATGGSPIDIDINKEMDMLSINVRAVHYLTRLYLADMIKKDKAKILNVSSLSGWLPTPFLSAYAAGKAYVLHLSEGINFELRVLKSKVRVSSVTPGFFNTGITDGNGKIKEQKRSIEKYINKVVHEFLKGKEVINLGKDKQIDILNYFTHRSIAKKIMFKSFMKGIEQ